MALLSSLAIASRPLRRRLTPGRFKETYVNRALSRRAHATVYVEIGVRDGESFRLTRADRRVGVDPQPTSAMDVLQEHEELFRTTSDAFFAEYAADTLDLRGVDVALIDGLHEFEQALRDLLNLERYMRPDGVVIFDDMNPTSAARASDRPTRGAWNGDVWKVGAFLTAERPDLHFLTIADDQGIGVVTGFAGGQMKWPDEQCIAGYKALGYDYLESDRQRVLNIVPRRRFADLMTA
jgi:hypothetical protein